jgi:hypothetical protein
MIIFQRYHLFYYGRDRDCDFFLSTRPPARSRSDVQSKDSLAVEQIVAVSHQND